MVFPNSVWDGLSAGRERTDDFSPDSDDFKALRDNLQAVQSYALSGGASTDLQTLINSSTTGDTILVSGSHAAITLKQGVNLRGSGSITTLTFTPTGDVDLVSRVSGLSIAEINMDATGMEDLVDGESTIAVYSTLLLDNCALQEVNLIARGPDLWQDRIMLKNCTGLVEQDDTDAVQQNIVITSDEGEVFANNSVITNFTATGTGKLTVTNSEILNEVVLGDEGFYGHEGGSVKHVTLGDNNPNALITNALVTGSLTAGAGSYLDAKACVFTKAARDGCTGPGTIYRPVARGQAETSPGAGDKTITIDPPIGLATYQVYLTEIANVPGASVSVKSKDVDEFIIRDTVGGRTFDWEIRL